MRRNKKVLNQNSAAKSNMRHSEALLRCQASAPASIVEQQPDKIPGAKAVKLRSSSVMQLFCSFGRAAGTISMRRNKKVLNQNSAAKSNMRHSEAMLRCQASASASIVEQQPDKIPGAKAVKLCSSSVMQLSCSLDRAAGTISMRRSERLTEHPRETGGTAQMSGICPSGHHRTAARQDS